MRWPFISFIRNLSGLHCCLFVKVPLLLLSSNSFILSQVICFVNNFFQDFLFFSAASLNFRSCWLPRKTKPSLGSLLDSSRQSPLAFYQTFSDLSIPFLKNFYFLFCSSKFPLYCFSSNSHSSCRLPFVFSPVRRALVYNTKSCRFCQQLFS